MLCAPHLHVSTAHVFLWGLEAAWRSGCPGVFLDPCISALLSPSSSSRVLSGAPLPCVFPALLLQRLLLDHHHALAQPPCPLFAPLYSWGRPYLYLPQPPTPEVRPAPSRPPALPQREPEAATDREGVLLVTQVLPARGV